MLELLKYYVRVRIFQEGPTHTRTLALILGQYFNRRVAADRRRRRRWLCGTAAPAQAGVCFYLKM